MSTPHNAAQPGEICKIVLMPGDPLRAKHIADTYLDNVRCFNSIRNMYGYSGFFQGKPVSVMASGMGMPSIGIYSYELFHFYDVETIIRLGSCGAYTNDCQLRDVLLIESAWSESSFAKAQSQDNESIQYPDLEVNNILAQTANEKNISIKPVRIHSSDVFYHEDETAQNKAIRMGCKAVEMESFALFHNAKVLHKKAACLCTVSDSLVSTQELTPQEREQTMDSMIELALNSILKM